jgi:branched-chain amino acid aminotransferase
VARNLAQALPDADALPLCVDLDGTLLKIDSLFEAAISTTLADWRNLLRLPFWLARGRAYLKHRIAERWSFNPAHLPYNEDLLAFLRNEHLRGAAGDWWIGQRVSRGVDPIIDEVPEHSGPNVVVECTPLPLKARARQFRDGLDVWTPAQRRIAPDMLSPRAKTHNYLNMIVAEQSVKAHDPEGWAVLLDVNGNLAEGMGSNIFVVRGGTLYTPSERYVLPGISRQMTLDLARKVAITAIEGDIDLFDAANAEEMFLTSTSLCIAGVRSFNGAKIGDGRAPGPITRRLIDAYIAEVGCDFVQQYLDRLS